jgi:aspartate/methionine/tyrosine aminotransferase
VLADSQFGPPVQGEGHHVRFSYATAEAQIEAGLERLRDWIRRSKR